MSKIVNDEIILTKAESANSRKALISPDLASMRKMNAFLEKTDPAKVERIDDNTVILDIPGIVLPTIITDEVHDSAMVEPKVEYSKIKANINVKYNVRKKVQIQRG